MLNSLVHESCHNNLTFGCQGLTFNSLMGYLGPSSTTGIDYLEGDLGQTEFTPSGCLSLSTVTEPLLGMLKSIFSRMILVCTSFCIL